MNTIRILGAVALSSFFAAAALADNPRTVSSAQSAGNTVLCQVASTAATGATEPGMCVLPNGTSTIVTSHLK
jgi:hypothetical protein